MAKRAPASIYAVHPSIQLIEHWIADLKAKTGRSLDDWVRLVRAKGPKTESARRDWLKDEQGLGAQAAGWIAERSVRNGTTKVEDVDTPAGYLAAAPRWVDGMYESKPALRPAHDRLVALARSIGKDIRICPCQTIVPIYRHHVIAQVKPATKARIDFGLALGPHIKAGRTTFPKRLIDTGGFAKKDRITHRIPVASPEDIDAEVERWLILAYEADAKA